MELSEKNSGGLFWIHTLPQFASSNWPVITNLKNTVDVRYDRASSVPQRAGSGSKRVRSCVIPCQKTPKNDTAPRRRQKLWPRVWIRAEMCVIEPRYDAGSRTHRPADLQKLFAGGSPYVPVAPWPSSLPGRPFSLDKSPPVPGWRRSEERKSKWTWRMFQSKSRSLLSPQRSVKPRPRFLCKFSPGAANRSSAILGATASGSVSNTRMEIK